jgi:hypothetical protein
MLIVSSLVTAPGLTQQAKEATQIRQLERKQRIEALEEKAASARKQQIIDAKERSRRDPSRIYLPERPADY